MSAAVGQASSLSANAHDLPNGSVDEFNGGATRINSHPFGLRDRLEALSYCKGPAQGCQALTMLILGGTARLAVRPASIWAKSTIDFADASKLTRSNPTKGIRVKMDTHRLLALREPPEARHVAVEFS